MSNQTRDTYFKIKTQWIFNKWSCVSTVLLLVCVVKQVLLDWTVLWPYGRMQTCNREPRQNIKIKKLLFFPLPQENFFNYFKQPMFFFSKTQKLHSSHWHLTNQILQFWCLDIHSWDSYHSHNPIIWFVVQGSKISFWNPQWQHISPENNLVTQSLAVNSFYSQNFHKQNWHNWQ